MQTKQASIIRGRSRQGGFTLIELIVVIVILGILAATALPRFTNMAPDARLAKIQAARGAILSAAALFHGKWLIAGSPATGTSTYDTVVVDNTTGYPSLAGMLTATGGLSEYDVSTFATDGVVKVDSTHATCAVTYSATAAGGAVVSAIPALASCQ